jgi:hypothetical protein
MIVPPAAPTNAGRRPDHLFSKKRAEFSAALQGFDWTALFNAERTGTPTIAEPA